ncbi:MAG: endonuclease III domain-containing protein [Parcubacteria group bacterium]|jgi:endonuclease-3 related protein
MLKLYNIYKQLDAAYGPQGWWPLVGHAGTNPTKTGAVQGYHVGDYTFPKNKNQQFEICLGTILTQNTAWSAVEKSLLNLKKINALAPEAILQLEEEALKVAIRPSGYHNQKARYIRNFTLFFQGLGERVPAREELLALVGIGPETADSMLLYAFGQPEFVVDTYTKRILMALGLIAENASYASVKQLCEEALQKEIADPKELMMAYQEFHALLVEHAKRYYARKPYGQNDKLLLKNKKTAL